MDNKDFFKNKRSWSETKDQLLSCYFTPYINKIMRTGKPLVYVDCFAGAGKFEDGTDGSPRIVLKIIEESKLYNIHPYFIEPVYFDELKDALREFPFANVVRGEWREEIENIVSQKSNYNLFMYVDPFGIKDLDSEYFFGLIGRFQSVELLINFNSFGFFREACRILKVNVKKDVELDGIEEFIAPLSSDVEKKNDCIEAMNKFFGGNEWIKVVNSYKNGEINGDKAEQMLAQYYCDNLRKHYKFVLNMPIRVKKCNRPKYRMIHATNHKDGFILMNDNMCSRWEVLQAVQEENAGLGTSLFEETPENNIISNEDIENLLLQILDEKQYAPIGLNDLLVEFIQRNGVVAATKALKAILKLKEANGEIVVEREPKFTASGRKRTFMSEDKGNHVFIQKVRK